LPETIWQKIFFDRIKKVNEFMLQIQGWLSAKQQKRKNNSIKCEVISGEFTNL
jgi:hypothetical protein